MPRVLLESAIGRLLLLNTEFISNTIPAIAGLLVASTPLRTSQMSAPYANSHTYKYSEPELRQYLRSFEGMAITQSDFFAGRKPL